MTTSKQQQILNCAVPYQPEHNHFADGGLHDCPRCRLDHAAPKLLDALKKAETFIRLMGKTGCGIDYNEDNPMTRAIAKAEGGAR